MKRTMPQCSTEPSIISTLKQKQKPNSQKSTSSKWGTNTTGQSCYVDGKFTNTAGRGPDSAVCSPVWIRLCTRKPSSAQALSSHILAGKLHIFSTQPEKDEAVLAVTEFHLLKWQNGDRFSGPNPEGSRLIFFPRERDWGRFWDTDQRKVSAAGPSASLAASPL